MTRAAAGVVFVSCSGIGAASVRAPVRRREVYGLRAADRAAMLGGTAAKLLGIKPWAASRRRAGAGGSRA